MRCTIYSPVVAHQFGKIILGTSSYFWRREDLPKSVKEELLDFVV